MITEKDEVRSDPVCRDTAYSDQADVVSVQAETDAQGRKHEDQWYHRNPDLLQAEMTVMLRRFPDAHYGYLENKGNMYWIVTHTVGMNPEFTKPWRFLILYDKNHPNCVKHGSSIQVALLTPSYEELLEIAQRHGHPYIPHTAVSNEIVAGHYLSLSLPNDYVSDRNDIKSALTMAHRAITWAAHFECGIMDKDIWNKWCGINHIRQLPLE